METLRENLEKKEEIKLEELESKEFWTKRSI